MYLRTKEFA